MFLTAIEWSGTALGLAGALIMASKKISPARSWQVWIFSSILFIYLFVNTQQWGLLAMNAFGLTTGSIGYWQWSTHKNYNPKVMRIAFIISMTLLALALSLTIAFLLSPKLSKIEWFGSLLSMSGALLLASKHRHAARSWLIWTVGNLTLLVLGVYNEQWGFATLQLGFTISNIWGTIVWLGLIKKPATLTCPAPVEGTLST